MKVEIIKCLKDNYSYLIIDEKNNYACVVDPSEAQPIIDFIKSKKIDLKFILNTHHHHDHVGGNTELKKKYGSKIIGFKNDKERIPDIDILVENIVFTGDTLFSLGCGRIFEGTKEDMYTSLKKLKSLPKNTKVYCGHEYTLKNSLFCSKYESDNEELKKKILEINLKLEKNLPTIPSTIGDELACNVFLRAKNLEDFSKLRDLKDNF